MDQEKNVWIKIKDFNVNVHETDVVDIWNKDQDEVIASTYAFDAETIDFDPNYCNKCGTHWVTHNGDGSCVRD